MNVDEIVSDRIANLADLGVPVEAGDVAEVVCRTTRSDTSVLYEVLLSLRSLAGSAAEEGDDLALLWTESVDFGQTDDTVAGGRAFRQMARLQDAIAAHVWQVTR